MIAEVYRFTVRAGDRWELRLAANQQAHAYFDPPEAQPQDRSSLHIDMQVSVVEIYAPRGPVVRQGYEADVVATLPPDDGGDHGTWTTITTPDDF